MMEKCKNCGHNARTHTVIGYYTYGGKCKLWNCDCKELQFFY